MTLLEAMADIYMCLDSGDVLWAQCAVLAYEQESPGLPSCVFEKVLRAAIASDALLPQYEDFCKRAYGRRCYAEIVAQIAA